MKFWYAVGAGAFLGVAANAASPAGLVARYTFDRPYGHLEPDACGGEPLAVIRDGFEARKISEREAARFGRGIRLTERAGLVGKFPADKNFTLMFWLRPDAPDAANVLQVADFLTGDIDRSGNFQLTADRKSVKLPLKMNEWNVVAVRGAEGKLSLFVNGVEAGTIPMPAIDPRGKMFGFSRVGQAHRYFRGLLDEIRCYSAALGVEDLRRLAAPEFYAQEKLPLADAGAAQTLWLPQRVAELNGVAVNGEKVEWKLLRAPAGSRAAIAGTASARARLNLDKTGEYVVQFRAVNSDGAAAETQKIVLFEPQPADGGRPYVGKIRYGALNTRSEMCGKNPPEMYSSEEIARYFPEPKLKVCSDGFAADRFSAPPPAGAHPRIFFNPEELPELRRRLRYTESGMANYENLITLLDNRMRKLKPGESYPLMVDVDPKSVAAKGYQWGATLAAEAFRCLVEADSDGARRVIDQMLRQAKVQQKMMDAVPDRFRDDWRNYFQHVVGRNVTPYLYDFLHPWMTPAERAEIRAVIARATRDKWVLGMNSVTAQARSNWLSWCAGDMLQTVVAIEGEEGFPVEVYRELARTFRHWLVAGMYPGSGAAYEGMGKNAITAQNLLILTRRGENLLNSETARNFAGKFLLGCSQPRGPAVCMDDLWGGSRNRVNYGDVAPIRYAFPDDPAIDFVTRRAAGENYRNWAPAGTTYRYCSDLIPVIFGIDHLKNPAPLRAPREFFATEINLMTARSGWDEQAAFLYFLPRMHGGHNSPARGTFVFAALGRDWSLYPTGHNDKHALQHSVVTVDGKNQFALQDSRMLAYRALPDAVFGACDLRYVYGGSAPNKMTNNDFRLIKLDAPWENLPRSMQPHWYVGNRPNARIALDEPWSSPVGAAFRTAGLVRGKHSYAVVADDFKIDGKSHDFQWRMVLPPDLENAVECRGARAVLTDPETGARVLAAALDPAVKFSVQPSPDPKKYGKFSTLGFTVSGPELNSRVVLIPFPKGEAEPVVSDDGTIRFADGSIDRLMFRPGSDGRTRVAIERGGVRIMELP